MTDFTHFAWPGPVLKNNILKWTRPYRQPSPLTRLASQSEYLYFSLIPSPTLNKHPHQNYSGLLCGS